jgi:hypothetical protein
MVSKGWAFLYFSSMSPERDVALVFSCDPLRNLKQLIFSAVKKKIKNWRDIRLESPLINLHSLLKKNIFVRITLTAK